jgi:hypothetical protein
VLVSRTIEDKMKKFFGVHTKMVNFMNNRKFNPECLKILCVNLDKQHINLLQHTGIRWINRGRFLSRAFELKDVLQDYFQEDCRPEFAKYSEDEEWLQKLAYLQTFFIIGPEEQVSARPQHFFFYLKGQVRWI